MENILLHVWVFLGQPEPFSATRTVETLTTRLKTTKPWASHGVVWHMEGTLHSTLCTCSNILPSASASHDHQCLDLPLLLNIPFSCQLSHFLQTFSLCLSHLPPVYSLGSWLPAHTCWPCLQLTPRIPCPFSAKRPLSTETNGSCCSSATTGKRVWLHCGNWLPTF